MVGPSFARQASEWTAQHAAEAWWSDALQVGLPSTLALGVAALVARAIAQRRRYRAVGAMSERDLETVYEAVRAAERRTVGEIVPVVVERSDDHPDARWRAAVVLGLAGAIALAPTSLWNALVAEIAVGALAYALARALPGFARAFASERRATAAAEEQALQEFQRLDLARTEAATGVLIFVSLFERRVVVLGDRGIDEAVPKDHWAGVGRAVLDGVARGALRDGLVEGIRLAGERLAENFPWRQGDRNELPDRVVVRAR
jgi:putative membrane protein